MIAQTLLAVLGSIGPFVTYYKPSEICDEDADCAKWFADATSPVFTTWVYALSGALLSVIEL